MKKKTLQTFTLGALTLTIAVSTPMKAYASTPQAVSFRTAASGYSQTYFETADNFNDLVLCSEFECSSIYEDAKVEFDNLFKENPCKMIITEGDKYQYNSLGIDVKRDESLTEEYAFMLCRVAARYAEDVTPEMIFAIMGTESRYKYQSDNGFADGCCGIAKFHGEEGSQYLTELGIDADDYDGLDPLQSTLMCALILQDKIDIVKGDEEVPTEDNLIKALNCYNGWNSDKNQYGKTVIKLAKEYKAICLQRATNNLIKENEELLKQ